jgi:hypothetical protein
MFISFLYMLRATVCPSSGETTVSMRHLVYVTVYAPLSGMNPAYQTVVRTRDSSIQSNKYQVSHRYSHFSYWWRHSLPKHIEKRNIHTKKNWEPSWLYLEDYTGMHGQQNIKFKNCSISLLLEGCGIRSGDLFQLSHRRVQRRSVVNPIMNLEVP